jgi:hypothetical protein
MGFMDKVSAGFKNAPNKIGAGIDESKFNSKIRDLKKEIDVMKSELGDTIYQAFSSGDKFDYQPFCENIKAKYDEIETIENEKQEMLDAKAAEREKNRQEAEAKKK